MENYEDDNEEEFKLPFCRIPPPILEGYEQKVEKFYEKQKQNQFEKLAIKIARSKGLEIKCLHWDEKLGLRNISFFSGGLDLDDKFGSLRYSFHNIEPYTIHGQVAFEIAREYLEMLKEN